MMDQIQVIDMIYFYMRMKDLYFDFHQNLNSIKLSNFAESQSSNNKLQ